MTVQLELPRVESRHRQGLVFLDFWGETPSYFLPTSCLFTATVLYLVAVTIYYFEQTVWRPHAEIFVEQFSNVLHFL